MNSRTAFLGVVALTAMLSAASCSRGKQSATVVPRTPVELTVDNRSTGDITIFVIHDGRTDRLDRVEAVRTKKVTIPVRMIGVLGDLRLVGERQNARAGFEDRISTQSVTIQPCQRLEWTIEARVNQSTLGVYPVESCG